jgi:hypothetical protein
MMTMTEPQYHPSLKKFFKSIETWLINRDKDDEVGKISRDIYEALESDGLFRKGERVSLDSLGNYYAKKSCVLLGHGDIDCIATPLTWAITFRSLAFRFQAAIIHPDVSPLPFWTTMKAAGPAMLSQWHEAEICAKVLINAAEKNQTLKTDKGRLDGWGKGTNDAFLIALFCEAFELKTDYYPVNPIIPDYQGVLDHWKTNDEATYRGVMQTAAEFHISRSKAGTEKNTYEFESHIDSVFPAELLAVQALRRRDGLPEFETGHLLIDTPWAVIRNLPEVEPHPLIAIVEARIKHDYPAFR